MMTRKNVVRGSMVALIGAASLVVGVGCESIGKRIDPQAYALGKQLEEQNGATRISIEGYNASVGKDAPQVRSWWDDDRGLNAKSYIVDGKEVDANDVDRTWEKTVVNLPNKDTDPTAFDASIAVLRKCLAGRTAGASMLGVMAQETRNGRYGFGEVATQTRAAEILEGRKAKVEAVVAQNTAALDSGDLSRLTAYLNPDKGGLAIEKRQAKGASFTEGDAHNAKSGLRAVEAGDVGAALNKAGKLAK